MAQVSLKWNEVVGRSRCGPRTAAVSGPKAGATVTIGSRRPGGTLARSQVGAAVRWAAPAITLLVLAAHAAADPRRFAYTNEANVMAPGHFEYEQWVTWKTAKDSDPRFDRFDFRHELEFGLTESLQAAVYLPNWRHEDNKDGSTTEFRSVSGELKWKLLDPTADVVGLALYGEYSAGPEVHELEAKVILHKNVGPWTFAYNAVFEVEWEEKSSQWDDKGVWENVFGVSYQVLPQLSVGAELLHEVESDDWEKLGDHAVYLGPNASVRFENWWITVTPLFQVTHLRGEPDFQVRMLVGIEF